MNGPEARLKERLGGHCGKWGHWRTEPDFLLPGRFPVLLWYLVAFPHPSSEWTEASLNPEAGGLCFKVHSRVVHPCPLSH